MAGCKHDGTKAGCGRLSLHAHGWWLREHCNGAGAGPDTGTHAVGAAVQVQGANRVRALLGLTAVKGSSREAKLLWERWLWRHRELGLAAAVAQVGRERKG